MRFITSLKDWFHKFKMSKDYTQKIRNLLIESPQTVPYIFERFYSVIKSITLSISSSNQEPKIFEQYSLIYRTVRKYIIDEPALLLNNTEKIEKQLKTLLNPLLTFINDDPVSRKILEYFLDKEINAKVGKFIQQAEQIKNELLAKNLKLKVFGTHEMANSFWIKKFKNEYAVHIESFWNAFLEFIEEIDFFQYFISVSSKKSIMKKVDPQKKYFVTSSNLSQLFYKLSEPDFLQKLADETAKGIKPLNFSSKDFLEMRFIPNQLSVFQTELIKDKIFELSGQDILIQDKRTVIKHPPTIIFGSSINSDIRIKNKYVSRKQFMVIEEEDEKFLSTEKRLPFSLVCLSSSNFTMVKYNREVKLRIGVIFMIGKNAIQVVKLANCIKEVTKQQDKGVDSDEDETLEYLPTKSSLEILEQKELSYVCISGPQKGTKGKLTQNDNNFQFQTSQQEIQLVYKNNEFYLPPNLRIFVKTANQVINGQLSDKLPLEEGMKIVLEECEFQIV